MRLLLLLIGLPQLCLGQATVTTQAFSEKRWIVNSSITLPAAKFHLATPGNIKEGTDPDKEAKGYLELFSSFGVGFSLNYGNATFKKNVETSETLPEETLFSNLIGAQIGVLYSSKLDEQHNNSVNEFSLYAGFNLLDLQLGAGYELGAKRKNATRWFVSVAYGIPIYKITGKGSFIFKKKNKVMEEDKIASLHLAKA